MTRKNLWMLTALVAGVWAGAARGQDVDSADQHAQDARAGPGLWRETDWCDVDAPAEGSRGNYVVNTWPGGVLPYRFNTNVSAQNQQRAIDAMAEIEAVCNVDFIPWTTACERICALIRSKPIIEYLFVCDSPAAGEMM